MGVCVCVRALPFGQLFYEQLLPHSLQHVLARYFQGLANLKSGACSTTLRLPPVPPETQVEI